MRASFLHGCQGRRHAHGVIRRASRAYATNVRMDQFVRSGRFTMRERDLRAAPRFPLSSSASGGLPVESPGHVMAAVWMAAVCIPAPRGTPARQCRIEHRECQGPAGIPDPYQIRCASKRIPRSTRTTDNGRHDMDANHIRHRVGIAGHNPKHMSESQRSVLGRKSHRHIRHPLRNDVWGRSSTTVAQDIHS
jgi:hypothetical protein